MHWPRLGIVAFVTRKSLPHDWEIKHYEMATELLIA